MSDETRKESPEKVGGGEAADLNVTDSQATERREALLKMGKLAAYAAPFTVLALTNKAEAATGHGGPKH
jgi:hypothetical protein